MSVTLRRKQKDLHGVGSFDLTATTDLETALAGTGLVEEDEDWVDKDAVGKPWGFWSVITSCLQKCKELKWDERTKVHTFGTEHR